jgi:hypothetical protein
MTTLFKKYSNIALSLLALVFLAVIVGYVAWSVGVFTTEAGVAFSLPAKPAEPISFDLKGAASLDLRGLTK